LFRHEIVGEVTEVGSEVKAFKVGETVGVGCMVNSCQTCESCTRHLEQYCQKKVIWTYSDKDYDGTLTQGGYSTIMVCKQEYVILILCVTLMLYFNKLKIKSLKL
jgi:D-arabinose 1-dehydrogenase-like Zn-dependent alcohol dehydrogenase